MRQLKLFAVSLALLLSSCGAYAIDPVDKDGKTFRVTDEEVKFCKANGGCTVVTNDEVARVSQAIAVLQQALEAEKQLRAAKSKRCI